MTRIDYPRNRPREFSWLAAAIVYFIASFFWIPYVAVHYLPMPEHETAGLLVFLANIMMIAFIMLARGRAFQTQTIADAKRVREFPRLSMADVHFIRDRELDVTLHTLESQWQQGQTQRPPRVFFGEFHNHDDWTLFKLARR